MDLKRVGRVVFSILCFSIWNKGIAQVQKPQPGKISTQNKNWQSGGIFDGKIPQQELLIARTEYTKKFDKGNGVIDIYFGGPFHFLDNTGAWQDINLDIKTQSSPTFKYVNEENRFISRFGSSANSGVQMEYKKGAINFGYNSKISAGNWEPTVGSKQDVLINSNTIQYKNIYNDIDLKYEISTAGLLHNIIFNNSNVFSNLPFGEQNLNVEETIQLPVNATLADNNGIIHFDKIINGNIAIVLNGDTIYTIQAAHIWDAAFTGNIEEQKQSPDIIESFKAIQLSVNFLSGNAVKLVASIPANWLRSPNRVYPIVFDPTVNIGNVASFGASYRYPFNTCRQQRRDQILFLKSDINAGGINLTGNITNIEFYQGTPNPIPNNSVQVKMLEVPWNEMTTETFTANLQTIHNSSNENYTSGSNVWRPLPVSSFAYTNTENLLIEVSFSNSTFTPGCTCSVAGVASGGYWGYFNAPYNGHRWMYSMSSAPPPSGSTCNYVNTPEGNPAYGNVIPATRITINTATGCAPIVFTSNPSSQSIVAPAQAQFSVAVSGTTPAYQWQLSTNGGTTWSNAPVGAPYSGNTTNQLTINPTSAAMNGYQYRCNVTNSCTSPSPATSTVGVLTVNAAGCATVISPTTKLKKDSSGYTWHTLQAAGSKEMF